MSSACIAPGCTVTTDLQRCKTCKQAVYCSKQCQRVDWELGHHMTCKPIATNGGSGTKGRKPDAGGRPKKPATAESLMPRIRLTLLDLVNILTDLRDNPPQARSHDFMDLLQDARRLAEKVVDLGEVMQLPIRGTLVPASTYSELLNTAIAAVRKLSDRLNDPTRADNLTLAKLHKVRRSVIDLVDRVRAVLLNPAVWLERFNQGSFLRMPAPEIVQILAQKQNPLELNGPPPPSATWRLVQEPVPAAIPATARDEERTPIVTDSVIYRFLEENMVIVDRASGTQQVVDYPAIRRSAHGLYGGYMAAADGLLYRTTFFSGLHGSIWEFARGRAANFRYSGGEWHMIQSVKVPDLGTSGHPVGVDKDNRLWMVQSEPPMVGMLRTDEGATAPSFVSWALSAEYQRLYSPVVTAAGLVAIALGAGRANAGKTGLVRFSVDKSNGHTMESLRVSSQAVLLANERDLTDADMDDPEITEDDLGDVRLAGDRVSDQLSVWDDQNAQLHVHSLHTRQTTTYAIARGEEFANTSLMGFALGNDGRSYFILYQGVAMRGGTADWNTKLFRLSAQ